MKKLSILIAMILCVTIGGVYAAWNYAGTSTDIGLQINQTVQLEQSSQNGAAGTYSLSHNITAINITPDDQTTKNATIVATYSQGNAPVFELTFKPATNAGDVIETNALTSYVYFGTERSFIWDHDANSETEKVNVFTFPCGKPIADKQEPKVIATADQQTEGPKWTWDQAAGVFKCTLTFASITDIITFDSNVHLPTIEDYNRFQSEVFFGGHSLQLHMHISNIAPTA